MGFQTKNSTTFSFGGESLAYDDLLLENSSYLLLENSDNMQMESADEGYGTVYSYQTKNSGF